VAILGESIKNRREILDLSQEQVAQATDGDVTVSTLGKIERGETRNPNRTTLRAIAKVLGIIPNHLFDLADGKSGELSVEAFYDPHSFAGGSVGSYAKAVPEQLRQHPHLKRWAPVVNNSQGGQAQEYTDPYANTGHGGQYLPIPPDAIPDGDLFFVRVVGDSMREYIRPGDWVLCTPNTRFVDGAVYCVQFDGERANGNCLKFVFKRDAEHYELRPGNPMFNSEVVRIEGVALAMAVGVYRAIREVVGKRQGNE